MLFFPREDYDLDFETKPIYDITVTCYDPIHHNTISKNFSIAVSDVNEAPVELLLQPDTVGEGRGRRALNRDVSFSVTGEFSRWICHWSIENDRSGSEYDESNISIHDHH